MSILPSHLVFLLGLLCYLVIRGAFQRRTAAQNKVAQRSTAIDRALVGIVVIGQMILPLLFLVTPLLNWANYPVGAPGAWVGGPVLAAGLWLFYRSHADLGRNWSVSLDLYSQHKLVTDGVYRIIRHPMYASFFLMSIAQALLLSNWIAGWSAFVAVSMLYVVRKPAEEAMMIEGFGEEYRLYMRRSGGIFPRFPAQADT